MKTYKAALIGCSRMGAFIDNEVPAGRYPYSHAAGYEACDRTELVACADLRPEVMAQVGERYGVPPERQYTDYRELMEREQPDIVSVATQPEPRAGIVCYVANNGAKAIYAEKAMAASMADADAMVEACESNGVFFNLGTNRRWDRGFDVMKEIIDSGRLGRLVALTIYNTTSLFNGASHSFDLIMRLNSDQPALWVQGLLRDADHAIDDGKISIDPVGEGIIEFENGVTGYALNAGGRRAEWEAVCEDGVMTALSNGEEWQLRERGEPDHRGRKSLVAGRFPGYEWKSPTLTLLEDLVHSLDTGEPPRGGVRAARASTELIFAVIESHMRGGARVSLPLEGSAIRMERGVLVRQPRFERQD
jgi:predicted dehydrogenase